jgi:putative endonuclease
MKCFTYILLCNDGSYYTGITWNLNKRVNEHNLRVKTPLQRSKLPVKLVYWEEFQDRIAAAKREKEIKGWRREKKELLINNIQNNSVRSKISF